MVIQIKSWVYNDRDIQTKLGGSVIMGCKVINFNEAKAEKQYKEFTYNDKYVEVDYNTYHNIIKFKNRDIRRELVGGYVKLLNA